MAVRGLTTSSRSNKFLHQNGQSYTGVVPPNLIFDRYQGNFQGRAVKRLGTELLWLRISGAILPLPLYAFLPWTEKTSLFTAFLTTLLVTQFIQRRIA